MAFKRAPTEKTDYEIEDKADDDDQPTTILDLIQEFKDADKRLENVRGRTRTNEAFVLGDQYKVWSEQNQTLETLMQPDDVPQVSRNYLRNLWNTWSARLLEDRPDVHAWPNEASGSDIGAAEVANAYMAHQHSIQDLDDLSFELIGQSQLSGMCAIKVVWDPTAGPLSQGVEELNQETGEMEADGQGEPTGEIQWEIATVFDFYSDPSAQRLEDANWVVFKRYIEKASARILLRNAGLDEDPEITPIDNMDDDVNDDIKAVELTEVWYRPGARIPEGLYAVVCSGHVIEATDFPYDHGQLPLSIIKITEQRNMAPGPKTHLDDAVIIQRQINELCASRARLIREWGAVRLIASDAIIDALEASNHAIKCSDPEQSKAIRWLDPPAMPKMFDDELMQLENAIFAVFGLNEMLTGAENVKSGTPARTIAYLTKLDSMKLSGSARSLGKCLRRAWTQTLSLAQQYVQEPRILQIVGEDKVLQTATFVGADMGGVDVRLEPASGIERYRAAQIEELEQDAALGWVDPSTAQQRHETGLSETTDDTASRARVEAQIMALLQGQVTPPMQDVDPAIAIEELRLAIEGIAGERPDILPLLQQLLSAYEQMKAQLLLMAQQPQGEVSAPPQQPTQPPVTETIQ